MKKGIRLIIIIFCLLFITGCGHIKSEKQVTKMARKKFGPMDLVETNTVSDEEIEYIYKDKEYGFIYGCTSYMASFNIDGSTFFTYPSISCDFKSKYKEHIFSVIKNERTVLDNHLLMEYEDLYYDGNAGSIESYQPPCTESTGFVWVAESYTMLKHT